MHKTVYMVTGASRGLGAEFVKQLHEKNGIVIACARHPEQSAQLKPLLSQAHVKGVQMDITDMHSIENAMEQVKRFAPDGVDVLINNAGITGPKGYNVENIPGSIYKDVFDSNVVGTSNVIQAVLPLLRQRQTRQIINMSTILGSIQETTAGNTAAYRLSKAGLNMLTKMWAGHLQPEGFTVVAMHPGWVKTDLGGKDAPLTPPEAVHSVLEQLGLLDSKDNGKFVSYKGESVPW